MQHLFLQQSYMDCYEAYEKSLRKESAIRWDYVILTASNEAQAKSYRQQITYRQDSGYLPQETRFVVLPDPEGRRVGSGGATLHVLNYIAQDLGPAQNGNNLFQNKRVLVIHSGGDSKRVPQYSVCGKLFSPVPRKLPDGRSSTLFDEFMIGMAGVAGRLRDGMLVLSGDVLLLFNPLQIDFSFHGAAALSMKEPVSVGKNHGVFLNDGQEFVGRFLHKQTEEMLHQAGAVNDSGLVDLDTGAVALDTDMMQSLYSLICKNGKTDAEAFAQFVNDKVRLSFYGDFLYPLAAQAGLEDYLEQAAEGEMSQELLTCRRAIWEAISKYKMRLLSLSPADFIHFGTTRELHHLVTKSVEDYRFLGWERSVLCNVEGQGFAAYNSIVEDRLAIGEKVYIEHSVVHCGVRIGNGSILSSLVVGEETGGKVVIPPNVVMHGIRLLDGRFVVRIYPVDANPKDTCEAYLPTRLWQETGEGKSLWEAKLYPICNSWQEAVEGALTAYRMMQGCASVEEKKWWNEQERTSLRDSFEQADATTALEDTKELESKIRVMCFVEQLAGRKPWSEAMVVFGRMGLTVEQAKMLSELAVDVPFGEKIRIYYALMQWAKQQEMDYTKWEELCFGTIKTVIYEGALETLKGTQAQQLIKETVHVELPVRVNWGGGWSDTPPHCLEEGGTVLNAAIKLNGIWPVQVTVRRLEERKIEVASEDVGVYGELHSLEEIRDCSNPYDAFALHKAALLACGIIPFEGGTLEDVLKDLGGGLFLSTQVIGVPKGSGLGTSSILAGACVKALFEITGREVQEDTLYDMVLCMEQLMSTGGGWQDQAGGLMPGIKFITSAPGMHQHIKVEIVEMTAAARAELSERFALIYTGQRRLARNLLRDVVGGYIGGRPETKDALFRMQRLAVLMRFELEKGNIDGFAALLNEHWELSKQLDSGSTNTCIEQIFLACEELLEGRFIAGAGGGGFLQVILKKGVSRKQLREKLREVFQDSGVEVWDTEIW